MRSFAEKIRIACGCPEAQVFFLAGGTQTNEIVIDSVLRKYEGVIAATTGHINVHEAGAVELTGHKVIGLEQNEGKLDPEAVLRYLEEFYSDENHEHMVQPGMVYISHPTEYGTLYTKAELERLSEICRGYGISLFMDGARLGYGLAATGTDVTLRDVAEYCDVFYIGGTKVGALCGEAVVFTGGSMPDHFVTTVKAHGALLAKGRLLGIQFDVLFTDGLYMELGRHAIEKAERLRNIFREKGYRFAIDSPTNQIFVILEEKFRQELAAKVSSSYWEKYDDDHTVVRFATSWATTDEAIDLLEEML